MYMKRIVLLICLILSAAVLLTGCKSADYNRAMALFDEGKYAEAAAIFEALGDYEYSEDMLLSCKYQSAKELFDAKDYEGAKSAFAALGDYKDCAEWVVKCDYSVAVDYFEKGYYENAVAIFETLNGYADSADKIRAAKIQLMKKKYGNVIDALNGHTWFYSAGSDNSLGGISFSDNGASFKKVTFDKKGKHDAGGEICSYSLDDHCITVMKNDGTAVVIEYKMSGGSVDLVGGGYFSEAEIDDGVQGYWHYRVSAYVKGKLEVTEKNICFDEGKVTAESAAKIHGGKKGEYDYFGPFEGEYKIGFGDFVTDIEGGGEWFFTIIDDEVAVLYLDHVCDIADSLPGKEGYVFFYNSNSSDDDTSESGESSDDE